jgi:hypothetical protein
MDKLTNPPTQSTKIGELVLFANSLSAYMRWAETVALLEGIDGIDNDWTDEDDPSAQMMTDIAHVLVADMMKLNRHSPDYAKYLSDNTQGLSLEAKRAREAELAQMVQDAFTVAWRVNAEWQIELEDREDEDE